MDWARAKRPKSGGDDLITAVARIEMFGLHDQYRPAVERWEACMGVPQPPLTVISTRTKKPTINTRFVEWLMGVAPGWVTDVPKLSPKPAGHRGASLSLLGDGVVKQQAIASFGYLLRELERNK